MFQSALEQPFSRKRRFKNRLRNTFTNPYNIITLIALILLDVVLLVATQHKATKIMLPVLVAMLVLSVILGTHLTFTGSVLDMFLMLAPAAVGTGLLLRAMLKKKG